MKKLKQIMLISSNFETFGKRLWRMVDVNALKPVKINKEKSKWKHFDTLEDIVEYYELKNVKVLNKSNDVDNILWFLNLDEEENDDEFWLADIEGEDYKKNDVDDLNGFVEYLETFHRGDGWGDGYGNNFDGNGNFQYRIDYFTGDKSPIMMTSENTIYDPILRQSVLKNEQSNIHDIINERPKWLSNEVILEVKKLWDTPNTGNNPRLKADELICTTAKKHGYLINVIRSREIIEEHCL